MAGNTRIFIPGPNKIFLWMDRTNPKNPAMVYSGSHSSTYYHAVETGLIDDKVRLSDVEVMWLNKYSNEVIHTYELARTNNPQYNL